MIESASRRILAVKVAGLADTLTITPALRALRETFPGVTVDGLLSGLGAEALAGTGLLDQVAIQDREPGSEPSRPDPQGPWWATLGLARRIRRAGYDRIIFFHHLTSKTGTRQLALIARLSGARTLGLDNGQGGFLHDRCTDFGFGARHEVEYWLDLVGVIGARTPDQALSVARSPEADRRAAQLLDGLDGPRLVIHPGSGRFSVARRWLPDRIAAVARKVREVYGAAIVLVGEASERELNQDLAARIGPPLRDLTGRTDLPTLAGVLAQSAIVLDNDSGIGQVAAAVGTPVVAVFGPSNDQARRPWTGRPAPDHDHDQTPSGLAIGLNPAVVVRTEIPCSPCFLVDRGLGRPAGCPARTCLDGITAAQVGAAISRQLGARKRALSVRGG